MMPSLESICARRVPGMCANSRKKSAAEAAKNSAVLEAVAKDAYLSERMNAPTANIFLQKKHYFRKHGANAYYGQK